MSVRFSRCPGSLGVFPDYGYMLLFFQWFCLNSLDSLNLKLFVFREAFLLPVSFSFFFFQNSTIHMWVCWISRTSLFPFPTGLLDLRIFASGSTHFILLIFLAPGGEYPQLMISLNSSADILRNESVCSWEVFYHVLNTNLFKWSG